MFFGFFFLFIFAIMTHGFVIEDAIRFSPEIFDLTCLTITRAYLAFLSRGGGGQNLRTFTGVSRIQKEIALQTQIPCLLKKKDT